MKILKNKDFLETTWSGGKTKQLYIFPRDKVFKKDEFSYRISTATVELEESDFTPMIGYKRIIASLIGDAKLNINGKVHELKNLSNIIYFNGSDKVKSKGKITDFNFIYEDKSNAIMDYKEITEETIITPLFIYVIRGNLIVDGKEMSDDEILINDINQQLSLTGNAKIIFGSIH